MTTKKFNINTHAFDSFFKHDIADTIPEGESAKITREEIQQHQNTIAPNNQSTKTPQSVHRATVSFYGDNWLFVSVISRTLGMTTTQYINALIANAMQRRIKPWQAVLAQLQENEDRKEENHEDNK